MNNKPALKFTLVNGTVYELPFDVNKAINTTLFNIWKKPDGDDGVLSVSNLPIFQGDGDVIHGKGLHWSDFAEKAYPYIRQVVEAYKKSETVRIVEMLEHFIARADDLFSVGRLMQPKLVDLTGTWAPGLEKPVIGELLDLFTDMVVVDGMFDTWRFRAMCEARKDCRITSIYNGYKDGGKICMLVIHWKNISVKFQLHQNQTYMHVQMPLTSSEQNVL